MANESELTKEIFPISILHSSEQKDGENWITGDVIKRWTDNPLGVSPEYPYEFCCTRYYTYRDKDNAAIPNSDKKGWEPWSTDNISLWAHYGMNASPYQLLFGNPYETIYAIEASGASREAYVILDGDGVSTGEIILLGGNENSKGIYDIKIDKLCIIDLNNIEHFFNNSNYLTLDLGNNWNCRFLLSNNNGNPIISLVGIGPNPDSKITEVELPDTIELSNTDSCFKCDLGGKYQKKIVIKATNLEKNISKASSWTITAIRDKNGDGIWRYLIMPNIDRVVRSSYFKKISDSLSNLINTVYNIGDANSVKFDIEKDTYGLAWRDITNQECRVVIKNPYGGEAITVSANGGPITIPFEKLQSVVDAMANANPTLTQTLQYTVELQVVDPDYEATSEGYSVVDRCNLLFEYIVCEAGKDGEDGKDGKSLIFNLSNDSGSFTYDYTNNSVKINTNDNSTQIQYIVDSNFLCCDSIKIGETSFSNAGSGTVGRVSYSVTKEVNYWTLTVNSISSGSYTSVLTIPIVGKVGDNEVGSATFKMNGVEDFNRDGVYVYRIETEHPYSTENSSSSDKLELYVHRDVLVEGSGIRASIPILIDVVSKDTGNSIGSKTGSVSCGSKAHIDTGVTMDTVQSNKGVILLVYAKDDDYKNRTSKNGYYFTGESEEIAYTVTATLDEDLLAQVINNLTVSFTGQAARIRNWESGKNYFPVYSNVSDLASDQTTLLNIYTSLSSLDDGAKEVVLADIGNDSYYCPKFYDLVTHGKLADNQAKMWRALTYSSTSEPSESNSNWEAALQYNFIAANAAYIESLAAKNISAERILVNNDDGNVVAGIINGAPAFGGDQASVAGDLVVMFAGLPADADSLKKAAFYVQKDGTVHMSKGSIGVDVSGTGSGNSEGSNGTYTPTEEDIAKWNLLTVNGKFYGDVEAKSLKVGDTTNFLQFCSYLQAKNIVSTVTGNSEVSIEGVSVDLQDDTMILLVRSGTRFFVLNPLQLGNGADLLIGYFCYIELGNIVYSSSKIDVTGNSYVKVDPDFSIIDNVKLGYIKYSSKSNSLSLFTERGDILTTDSNISIFSFGTSENAAYQSAGNCSKSLIGTIDKSEILVYGYAFGKSEISSSKITTTDPIYRIIDSNNTINFNTSTTNLGVIDMGNFVYSGSGGYTTTSESISVLKPDYYKYIVNLSSNLLNYKEKVTTIQLDTNNTFSDITHYPIYFSSGVWTKSKPDSSYTEYEVYIYTHEGGKPFTSGIYFKCEGESLASQKFIIIMLTYDGSKITVSNLKSLAEACGITTGYYLIGTFPDTVITIPTSYGITIHSYSTAKVSLIYNNSEYKGKLTNFYEGSGPAYKSGGSSTGIYFSNDASIIITKDDMGNVGKGLKILNSLGSSTYFSTLSAYKIKKTCYEDFSIYYGVGLEYNLAGAYINTSSIDSVTHIIGKGQVNANNYEIFKPYRLFDIEGTSLYDDGKKPILSILNNIDKTLSVSQLINGHFLGVQESFFGNIKIE